MQYMVDIAVHGECALSVMRVGICKSKVMILLPESNRTSWHYVERGTIGLWSAVKLVVSRSSLSSCRSRRVMTSVLISPCDLPARERLGSYAEVDLFLEF